jgi:hypothetical protein
MEVLIKNLELSSQIFNDYHLFNAVNKNLFHYDSDKLIEICNDWIRQNKFIKMEKIENSDKFYEKYYLFENKSFSLVLIKWNKDCFTKIHDHPEKGCIMRVLNGSLKEESYSVKLNLISTNILNENKLGYKKGNRILHKIIALEDSVSLHVYIPGFYKSSYY